jgi:hypothetical protein
MAYTWHLLPRLTTYIWIILITLWLTLDFYYHVWRHMSRLSLSHYSLHWTYTTTFDDIFLNYLSYTIAYTWHLLPRLTTYIRIILSHYNIHLTSTTTFEDICLYSLNHTITYTWHLLPRLMTYVWINLITLQLTSDIYYHVWRHVSGLSLSHYSLHLTSTFTFDDICLDYLYHTVSYIWYLRLRLTTYNLD